MIQCRMNRIIFPAFYFNRQTDGFRFYFTPLLGVLPTFPSQYWYTIGLLGVFSLAGWSPRIQTGFHVSRPTQVPLLMRLPCLYRTITVFGRTFQIVPVRQSHSFERSYYPGDAVTTPVWALPRSIATTKGIDNFFLFLGVLRCFSSPRSLQLSW